MNRKLTWRHLKALNQLYVNKRTKAKILDNLYIVNVLGAQKKLLKVKSGNAKIIEASKQYETFYEENFKSNYERYYTFFQNYKLEDNARIKYTEQDIETLIFLAEYKEVLSKNLTTIRTFSSEIFKGHGSKYLENKPGLKRAVCKILDIPDFPEKDPKNLQWRLVVDCVNPKAIILCENIAHLKTPWKAREENVELWYVGGNNIAIIDFISLDKFVKPVYYSCDWDFHGLSIYSRLKAKLSHKSSEIRILKPYNIKLAISVHSDHHNSEWKFNLPLSGLGKDDFHDFEQSIIEILIKENTWIEEESMNFEQLLAYNNV